MILQKVGMDPSSEKTAEAKCGGKCSRETIGKVNLDVAWEIGANCYKKKLIAKNASQIKQQIRANIHELVETLLQREQELYLAVDDECINQMEIVDNTIAKISGHCCNTVNTAYVQEHSRSYERDSNFFPVIKLDFKSNWDELKPQLKKFGNLSLRDCNGYDYVELPRAPVVSKCDEQNKPPTFEKWKKFNQKMEWFFKYVVDTDEMARTMSRDTNSDYAYDDDIYSMDPKELGINHATADDDIEIISENEVAEIPSQSSELPPERTPRRKLFSGKRSLPVLPCSIFQKNVKDKNVEAEKQNNTKLQHESPVPCSSVISNPESNSEVVAHNKENKSLKDCISTEAKKNQVPSAALAFSLFEHFNNNKEEWLASKINSKKVFTSESTSAKWLCPKDNYVKPIDSKKKLGQWLPHKENPKGGSWLSKDLQQC